jgi:cytochrome b
LVRVFHWGLVACVLAAYLAEDEALELHTWAGYGALALVGARLVWGFVGTGHARFADFVRGPRATLGYLRDELAGRARRYLGHNPAGAAMVLALLAGILATALTGMATLGANELAGPLAPWLAGVSDESAHAIEDVHEAIANLTMLLVPLHLAGVALASWLHRENLVLAMVDGRKREERP